MQYGSNAILAASGCGRAESTVMEIIAISVNYGAADLLETAKVTHSLAAVSIYLINDLCRCCLGRMVVQQWKCSLLGSLTMTKSS